MNPTTTVEPLQLIPPPKPPQPHRSSLSCDRHPQEQFTGFCPLCLCERLHTLDPNTSTTKHSSTAAALKSLLFKPPSSSNFPELRRSKSFSASKPDHPFSGPFEPQRHSCDVRARNTLHSLFSLDNCTTSEAVQQLSVQPAVHGEITPLGDIPSFCSTTATTNLDEIKENRITMKEKKKRSTSLWSAASVFSKKMHKWMRKQTKLKKTPATLPVEKPISRQFRETQSEIADYGFGRRSCDTGPRFSLDAGRAPFDDPRYSFDQPRASWDGNFVGRSFPRLPPTVEDENVPVVRRTDATIPVIEDNDDDDDGGGGFVIEEEEDDENVPGGSVQTREYYLDSRRRKSLDRSSSIRKTAAAVVAEIDELKGVSNAKVSPEPVECLNGGGGKVLMHSSSLRDDCSEGFELGFRENGDEMKGGKKWRRWNWNIWGLMHLRGGGGNKEEEEDKYGGSRGNWVERSFSESWQEIRREGNGEGNEAFGGRRVFRSNTSVSWRNSSNVVGGDFVSTRKSSVEMNGLGKNKNEKAVLERNRSAKCSANDIENGLLRFYLTPLRGSRRGGFGKSKSNNSHSIARNILRLY